MTALTAFDHFVCGDDDGMNALGRGSNHRRRSASLNPAQPLSIVVKLSPVREEFEWLCRRVLLCLSLALPCAPP